MAELGFKLEFVGSLDKKYDSIIIVGEKVDNALYPAFVSEYLSTVEEASKVDDCVTKVVTTFYEKTKTIPLLKIAGEILSLVFNSPLNVKYPEVLAEVFAPTGPLNRDYDDVRRFEDAANKGMQRVLKCGKRSPLLVVQNASGLSERYKDLLLVSLLGAFEALYVPIEIRDDVPSRKTKAELVGFSSKELNSEQASRFINTLTGIELGRIVARDIGGSDPEKMAPGNVAKYVSKIFENSSIKVKVTEGRQNLESDYPLFAAVDRCASHIERHTGRIIYLEYTGEDVKNTYLFVGKGVTYDTGGADIKAGGNMAGMHRDKCGAATVAGIFETLNALKPKGVKVVGRMAMVRNSCGADSYVADEIITSAAGVRVRVGNTDAEGRMAMADSLYHSKQQALDEENPHLMTIATLTGHAVIAVGEAYTVMLDNGPAREIRFADSVQKVGENLANPVEISTLRREDYDFVAARNEYEDTIQCNNTPSSRTPRGHQFPAAFMIRASALDKHGIDSEKPLKYTHIDIAGSSGPYPGIPTAAPLVALVKRMNAF